MGFQIQAIYINKAFSVFKSANLPNGHSNQKTSSGIRTSGPRDASRTIATRCPGVVVGESTLVPSG